MNIFSLTVGYHEFIVFTSMVAFLVFHTECHPQELKVTLSKITD